MEVIAALIVLHCQNYFDAFSCEQRMSNCVRYNYQILADLRLLDLDASPMPEETLYANAYHHCVENDLSIDIIDNY